MSALAALCHERTIPWVSRRIASRPQTPLTAIRKIPLYFPTGRITMAAIREE